MSQKPGYWIAHVHVTDPESYARYVEGARAAFEKYGAEFLARGGRHAELEGAQGRERHVVIRFASYQQALDCYGSPEYQAARKHRENAGEATLTIVEGL
ncbi:DUF1330 domain-containing protein [Oceanicella actignis]|uniref:Uncharacterized conserved protein, DUF1330 family n=1 Tax=Oceanicella actignis TaxID=1189325 RepID=A0A1M7T5M4_9RHOB|nr:DUF1330 domain-containing protein [Oceanicella actignis]TYO84879.1 uncharacterized protein (DUF1330 family) [Oceanicella actignis]SET43017.1 Uncharacterized conserved protein, DUF1330 family [Oceanicella actignis]SHN65902.1 Uncharacterized conserved protein, DUF1330 family [Oceanicella actignis]